jgi:hypothetical protein
MTPGLRLGLKMNLSFYNNLSNLSKSISGTSACSGKIQPALPSAKEHLLQELVFRLLQKGVSLDEPESLLPSFV